MEHIFETERLIIKQPKLSPKDLWTLPPKPEVMKYIAKASELKAKSELDKLLLASRQPQKDKKKGFGYYTAVDKQSGATVGMAGIIPAGFKDNMSQIFAACYVHQEFWGHQFASEILYPLIETCFNSAKGRCLVLTRYYDAQLISYKLYDHDLVHLDPYDQEWAVLAEQEITYLRSILPTEHIVEIEHIGSTAVPGMMAKPVIDLQIVVDSIDAIAQQSKDILKSLGYTYGDTHDPKWLFFLKGRRKAGEKRSHHIHIVENKSKRWEMHKFLKDYLIAYPETADDYTKFKQALELKYKYDRVAYTKSKEKYIDDILVKARLLYLP